MKPLILLTPTMSSEEPVFRVNDSYVKAIHNAGGLPVLAGRADFAALAERADGVLFTGGVDMDPARFGEAVLNDTVEISPARDELELALFEKAAARRLPMMGICRGIQTLNVALGGSLWQDIPAQLPGAPVHRGTKHAVIAAEGSLARALFGERFRTNSFHHQAVKEPGSGVIVTARAEDGVIEAIEHEDLPLWGFQWHPERMTGAYRAEDLTEMGPLFAAFIRRCAGEA